MLRLAPLEEFVLGLPLRADERPLRITAPLRTEHVPRLLDVDRTSSVFRARGPESRAAGVWPSGSLAVYMSEPSSTSGRRVEEGGRSLARGILLSIRACLELRDLEVGGKVPWPNKLFRVDGLDVERNKGTTKVLPGVVVIVELEELAVI